MPPVLKIFKTGGHPRVSNRDRTGDLQSHNLAL